MYVYCLEPLGAAHLGPAAQPWRCAAAAHTGSCRGSMCRLLACFCQRRPLSERSRPAGSQLGRQEIPWLKSLPKTFDVSMCELSPFSIYIDTRCSSVILFGEFRFSSGSDCARPSPECTSHNEEDKS